MDAPLPRQLLDHKPKAETFTITLRIEPGDIPAIARLKAALKLLGRAFRMRCVEIKPEPPGG